MIYFDLDGVIRDLCYAAAKRDFCDWREKINGKNLYEIIKEDKQILLNAPPTKYYGLIKLLPTVNILTHQMDNECIACTDKWVKMYLGNATVIYVTKTEDKLGYLKDGCYLIEDYPFYNDYSKIGLISHLYNQNVNDCLMRIKTIQDLETFIKLYQ